MRCNTPLIVSTNWIPRGFAAMTVWPLIFVRPECRNDAPLIEHELVHYREQIRQMGIFPIFMLVLIAFQTNASHLSLLWQVPLLVMSGPLLWVLRYLLFKKFRLAAEVRAYRRQIELGDLTQVQAAQLLTHYRLGITLADAQDALKDNHA